MRVSADNITRLTAETSFHGKSADLPPVSRDALIEEIAKGLKDNQKRNFKKLIAGVPRGFRLEPVYYACRNGGGTHLYNQFYWVRGQFYRHLARKYRTELRELGICQHGVNRMTKGQDPTDVQGRYYDVSIDHIVERGGSGLWARSAVFDSENKFSTAAVSPVNHFSNLILLPAEVHEFKNKLNILQGLSGMKAGQAKWALMMVPEDGVSPVCKPQVDEKGEKRALSFYRGHDVERRLKYASFMISRLNHDFEKFSKRKIASLTLKTFDEISRLKGFRVSDLANDNVPPSNASLSDIFESVVSYDSYASGYARKILRPKIEETAHYVGTIFDKVAKNAAQRPSDCRVLAKFAETGGVISLLNAAARLPFRESIHLLKTFQDIDGWKSTRSMPAPGGP